MMRRLVMVAVALAVCSMAAAGAEPRAQKSPKTQPSKAEPAPKSEPATSPLLHLYLARGGPDACGEGCREWIAVEGRFDANAAARAQAFLNRYRARNLPVYFHSPGGNGTAALAIGRYLRQYGITVGVAATVPRGCASMHDKTDSCRVAKRLAQPVDAEWRPDGSCHSACVWALLGGKVRHVPPSAQLGIHASRITVTRTDSEGRKQQISEKQAPAYHKAKAVAFASATQRYMREMGIDDALLAAAQKVPHEDIYILNRGEIAAYGIDRRDYAETGWFVTQLSNKSLVVTKWIVEATGTDRKAYRTSIVSFSCSGAQRARVLYIRGLGDEVATPVSVSVAVGGRKSNLALTGLPTQRNGIDNGSKFASLGGSLPFDAFDQAATLEVIELTEFDPVGRKQASRVLKLGASGLPESVKRLRESCRPAPA